MKILIGFCVALTLSGCSNNSATSLLYNGIGNDMVTGDSVDRALAAEKYFGHMCRRAGLPLLREVEDRVQCDYSKMAALEYRKVVYAALSDIDERCDAYIASLDTARKDKDAFLRQLRTIEDTTVGVIGLTSGASSIAVTIVQQAFGLGQDSIENYYSTFLLSLESTTIYSVVKKQQIAYRQNLLVDADKNFNRPIVSSKPTAYYAIRGYLRLCLPENIEAEVNTVISAVNYTPNNQGNGRNLSQSVNPSVNLVANYVPKDANTALLQRPPERPRAESPTGVLLSNFEKTGVRRADIAELQKNLCVEVPESDLGNFGSANSPTRQAIAEYRKNYYPGRNSELVKDPAAIEDLSFLTAVLRSGACAPYRNLFEKSRWRSGRADKVDAIELDNARILKALAVAAFCPAPNSPPGINRNQIPLITQVINANKGIVTRDGTRRGLVILTGKDSLSAETAVKIGAWADTYDLNSQNCTPK